MPAFTPVYGWPFQTLTDPPDGPNLGEDLALAIEATMKTVDAGRVALAGQVATLQTQVNALPVGLTRRAKRSAVKSGLAGSETGLVRLDNIPLAINHVYWVTTQLGQFGSTINETAQLVTLLRMDITGAAATAASPAFAVGRVLTQAGSGNGAGETSFLYQPAATQVGSIFFSHTRSVGAGTITATGPDGLGPEIWVVDLGTAQANNGVDL